MLSRLIPAALVGVALVPVAFAQEDEGSTQQNEGPYVYSTYLICDTDKQWLADELVNQYDSKAYAAAMEDGSISGWGWLAHHTGGQWRRVSYYVAPTLEALLDAQDAVDARREEQDSPQGSTSAFGQACGSHEDYIWQLVTGSQGAELDRERGKAGLSVYHVCDIAGEERADELVKSTFASLYDAQVEKGNLTSWGWMQHIVGGKYRRLETMTGKDHKSVLRAREEIIEQLMSRHKAEADEFDSICSSHSDYLWDIVHEE
ncbi:hypothetical protein BH24PSE2_BH24PSE2_07120 [soil metagenome]